MGRYGDCAQLHLSRFPRAAADGEAAFHFGVSALTRFETDAAEAVVELSQVAKDHEVHVFCDNAGEQQRLTEMTREQTPDSADRLQIRLGVLHGGFDWTRTRTIVVAHHELFRRHHQRRRVHRVHAGRPLESWTDLKPGDRVVHVDREYGEVELNQAANFINHEFAGLSLLSIRHALLKSMQVDKDNMNELMQTALNVASHAFADTGEEAGQELVVAGETNLLDMSGDAATVRTLLDAFSRKGSILHLLDRCLGSQGIQLFIGEESGYKLLDDVCLVTSPYEVNGELAGVLGVVGPTRMAYQDVIPVVDVTARVLGAAMNYL